MVIETDFSDIDRFFEEGKHEVLATMKEVGEEAVEYARENGSYRDRTGNLRKSNGLEVDESGVTLRNDAEYACFVESKGYEVLSGAALYAEKRLKEELE